MKYVLFLLLQPVLIILKLTGVLTFSWFLILIPLEVNILYFGKAVIKGGYSGIKKSNAKKAFQKGNYKQAIQHLTYLTERATAIKSNVYFLLGRCYFKLDRLKEAADIFEQVLHMEKEEENIKAKALIERGTVYFLQEKYKQAFTDFDRAIDLNPLAEYYFVRGKCYYKQDKLIKAEEDLKKALEKSSSCAKASRLLENIRIKKGSLELVEKDRESKVKITGEDKELIGIKILDNNNLEHVIEMGPDGEIKYHEQDEYPDDPSERTHEENERVNQVRYYAQYYTYLKRGYDTLLPARNPVRLEAVRVAIKDMNMQVFETHFGDLYRQFSYENGVCSQPVYEVPTVATTPPIYSQNIYLGIDPLEAGLDEQLIIEHDLNPAASATKIEARDISGEELENWTMSGSDFTEPDGFDGELDVLAKKLTLVESEIYVEKTSDIYVKHPQGSDLVAADEHLDKENRCPDAVLELLPIEVKSLAYFRSFLAYYLRCQIRDCFVEMGLTPPEFYQVLGLGRFMAARGYDYIDFYPEFHQPGEDSAG